MRSAMAAVLLLAVGCASGSPKSVWIDTDPSVQKGVHEVDDGFALVQAFRSSELAVRGVSVVFGNAPLAQAYPIGKDLVKRYGPPKMQVYRGAAGASDLGTETPASRALAYALKNERLTILVLGPATNVATVVKKHPELKKQIIEVIGVAGRRPGQRFRPSDNVRSFRDFNFELDAPAFQVLLDSGVKLVLAPWEISSKVWMTSTDLDSLAQSDPSLSFIVDAARDWLAFWKKDLHTLGFNPFDTLAIGYAISPVGFKCEQFSAAIRTLPDDTYTGAGTAPGKPYLLVGKPSSEAPTVTYCSDAGAGFKNDLLGRLRRGTASH